MKKAYCYNVFLNAMKSIKELQGCISVAPGYNPNICGAVPAHRDAFC